MFFLKFLCISVFFIIFFIDPSFAGINYWWNAVNWEAIPATVDFWWDEANWEAIPYVEISSEDDFFTMMQFLLKLWSIGWIISLMLSFFLAWWVFRKMSLNSLCHVSWGVSILASAVLYWSMALGGAVHFFIADPILTFIGVLVSVIIVPSLFLKSVLSLDYVSFWFSFKYFLSTMILTMIVYIILIAGTWFLITNFFF